MIFVKRQLGATAKLDVLRPIQTVSTGTLAPLPGVNTTLIQPGANLPPRSDIVKPEAIPEICFRQTGQRCNPGHVWKLSPSITIEGKTYYPSQNPCEINPIFWKCVPACEGTQAAEQIRHLLMYSFALREIERFSMLQVQCIKEAMDRNFVANIVLAAGYFLEGVYQLATLGADFGACVASGAAAAQKAFFPEDIAKCIDEWNDEIVAKCTLFPDQCHTYMNKPTETAKAEAKRLLETCYKDRDEARKCVQDPSCWRSTVENMVKDCLRIVKFSQGVSGLIRIAGDYSQCDWISERLETSRAIIENSGYTLAQLGIPSPGGYREAAALANKIAGGDCTPYLPPELQEVKIPPPVFARGSVQAFDKRMDAWRIAEPLARPQKDMQFMEVGSIPYKDIALRQVSVKDFERYTGHLVNVDALFPTPFYKKASFWGIVGGVTLAAGAIKATRKKT